MRLLVVSAAAFALAPVAVLIWLSFAADPVVTVPPSGYTLRWYRQAIETPTFLYAFATSLKVALAATVLGVAAGTLASIALVRIPFRGRALLRSVFLSPIAVPGIVLSTGIYLFYIQVERLGAYDLTDGLSGLVLAHCALTIPWSVRLVGAVLVGIDRSVEEAAASLGATPLTTFRRVTLPLMRGGIVAATLISCIVSFENLEVSLLLAGPGRSTLPIALMQYLEFRMDPTAAAVCALQILAIVGLLLLADRAVGLGRIV
ncbi:MAG TPA: ABC transporter permease [Beijerinckiaceae bacterium]|nr:ABC transporter permease [Beijerinckiaceae bacterium]